MTTAGPQDPISLGTSMVHSPSHIHFPITRQDFLVLKEGAGRPAEAAMRDLMLGASVSTLVSVVAFAVTATFLDAQHHVIGAPLIGLGLLVLVLLVTAGLCLSSHLRAEPTGGREPYAELVARIEATLPKA